MKLYQVFSKFELVNNFVSLLVSIMAEDSSLDSSFPLVYQESCNLVSNVEEGTQRSGVIAGESSGDEGLINYFIVKHFIFQSLNQIG